MELVPELYVDMEEVSNYFQNARALLAAEGDTPKAKNAPKEAPKPGTDRLTKICTW